MGDAPRIPGGTVAPLVERIMGISSILLDISRTDGQHLSYIYEINVCQVKKKKKTRYRVYDDFLNSQFQPICKEGVHPVITL